jgi:hypothetical protein
VNLGGTEKGKGKREKGKGKREKGKGKRENWDRPCRPSVGIAINVQPEWS